MRFGYLLHTVFNGQLQTVLYTTTEVSIQVEDSLTEYLVIT